MKSAISNLFLIACYFSMIAILMANLLISFLLDPQGSGKWPAEGADIQEL